MTNELRDELVEACKAGITGAFDPSDPAKPIARLQAAWAEASALERMVFKWEITKTDPFYGDPGLALMIAAAD